MADEERKVIDMQHHESFLEEAEFDRLKHSPETYPDSSFSFTRLMLTGQTCEETDMSEKIRAEISNSKRARPQLPNMDLSLLPSRKALDLVCTPKSTALQQLSPYPGHCSANLSAFRSPCQIKQQQQHSQLTIFYCGKVYAYNVTSDMAKVIMALASSGRVNPTASPANPTDIMCSTPTPGSPFSIEAHKSNLQLSQKHSLQRFLEKRSGRLQAKAPYANASLPQH